MAITKDSIRVLWDGYEPDATGNSPITGFKLCISNDNRNFNCITLGADVREHTFTSLTPNTTYYLTLQGVNAVGESDPVKLVGTTLDTVTEVPDAPIVTVRQSDEDESLVTTTVSDWESKEVSSVEVQKSTDNSTWSALATVSVIDKAEYQHFDENLTTGSTYYYRARAVNRVGNSDWSAVVSIEIEDCDNRCGVVSETTVRFEDATPEQKRSHSFILDPADEDFCGPYRECPPEPVSKPRNLVVSNIQHDRATAAWDSPLQTGGYDILKYVLNFGGDDIDITGRDALLENLNPSTEYTLSVKAVNKLGTVSLPATSTFTTLAEPPPPPKPKPNAPNVDSVSLQSDNRARITFDKSTDRVNKPVEQYKIYERTSTQDILLRTVGDADFSSEFDINTEASQTKMYTAPGTYSFFMRASNSDAESDDSNVVHFTIDEPEPKVPNAPTFDSLTRDDNGQVTAVFSYSNQGYAPVSFKIYEDLATDVVRDTVLAMLFLRGQNSISLSKVLSRRYTTPGTYRFYVVATNAEGDSDRSGVLSFTVAAVEPDRRPSAPRDVRVSQHHASNDKSFRWDLPNDFGKPEITGYTLFLRRVGSSVAASYAVAGNTTNTLRVSNLLYNTTYEVFVRAQNSAGFSDSTNTLRVTTGEGRPTPPLNLSLQLVNEVNVRASWQAPSSPNGIITGYRLYLRELLANAQWIRVDVSNVLTHLVENLERGKTFEFEVTSVNSAGESILTNNPQTITIPDFEKPGAVGLSCDLQGEDFVLSFTPPTETGGADLFKYRVAVTVPGQAGIRNLEFDYPQSAGVIVQENIKTLFSLANLPSGTYSFEASVRNTALDEYSDANAGSRCTINYTQPVSRPKPVTNIQFSVVSGFTTVTFNEPTDTGNYTFDVFLEYRQNSPATYSGQSTTFTKLNPSGDSWTYTSQIVGPLENATVTATITSRKAGTLETTTVKRSQVYERVVRVAQPPRAKSIQLYSDNVPRIIFDYPVGNEPVDSFRVYEVVSGTPTLRATITNTNVSPDNNIIKKVGTTTYTTAGTYTFYITSVNSAGESVASNRVSFTIAPPPPPPPPDRVQPPRLISVRRASDNTGGLIFNWDWPQRSRSRVRSIGFVELQGPGSDSSQSLPSINIRSVTQRRNIQTRVPPSRARELAGTYRFYAVCSYQPDAYTNSSDRSNVVSFTLDAPPPATPGSPNLRRVSLRSPFNNPFDSTRGFDHIANFVFDYPTTGGQVETFFLVVIKPDGTSRSQPVRADFYYRGQTSIDLSMIVAGRQSTIAPSGNYICYLFGRNRSGDGLSSRRVTVVVP